MPIRRRLRSPGLPHPGLGLAWAVVVATALATTTDPDLWWHLRTGEVIVDDGLPRVDIFSYTVPGRGWITHEWLSQVIMWAVYSAAGPTGLILGFALVTVVAFALAARTSASAAPFTAVALVLAALAAAIATGARPQMFNLVGVALVVLVLERVRLGTWSSSRLWWLPAIVVVWANLHSGYLLGIAVMAVYVLGEALAARTADRRPTIEPRARRRLALVVVLSFLVAVVNPSGPALWRYPFDTLRSSAMQELIVEWHSPDFHSPAVWPFAGLLALVVVTAAVVRPPLRFTQGLLLLGTGLAALQSVRHIPLFAIVSVPVLAEQLELAVRAHRSERIAPAVSRRSAVVPALAAVLAVVVGLMFVRGTIDANDEAVADQYPVAAVDHLVSEGLAPLPGFHAYHWGGYLVWRDVPVFVDGRADVYGDEFLLDFHRTYTVSPRWQRLLDDHGVVWVLIPPGSDLAVLLAESPGWTSAYADPVAEIFVRSP